MKRRNVLKSLLLASHADWLSQGVARADEKPWMMRLIAGPFANGVWQVGLEIVLQPHWKTYWRVPGEGGVPPAVEVKGGNVKSGTLLLPVPMRIAGGGVEAIGYAEKVMFVLQVTAVDASQPIMADVNVFLGVCKDICIPAQFAGQISTGMAASAVDVAALAAWQDMVPKFDEGLVQSAKAVLIDGKPAVDLELTRPVDDVFAEGNVLHYFQAPVFSGTHAVLKVAGALSVDELRATPLRITARIGQGGLEQTVSVV